MTLSLRITMSLLCVVQGVSIASAQLPSIPPIIASLSPENGPTTGGSQVTLVGSGFGASPGTITFDGQSITPSTWTPTSVTFIAPPGQGSSRIVRLTNSAGTGSNLVLFSYVAPMITGLSTSPDPSTQTPTLAVSASGLAQVYIHGHDFGPSPTVIVSSVSAFVGAVAPDHSWISIVVPTGVGTSIPITLLSGNQQAPAFSGLSYLPPVIAGIDTRIFDPLGGNGFTISGANFGYGETAQVFFGPHQQTNVTASNDVLYGVANPGSGVNLPVTIVVGGQSTTLPASVTYGYPTLSGVSPSWASVLGGTNVTISGTLLSGNQMNVTVGGRAATVLAFNENQVEIVVPPGDGHREDVVVSSDTFSMMLEGAIAYGYAAGENLARRFDGLDDVILVSPFPAADLLAADPGYVECWFRHDGIPQSGAEPTLLSIADAASPQAAAFRVWLDAGVLSARIGPNVVQGTSSVVDGQPHHVAVRYASYYLALDVDGVQEGVVYFGDPVTLGTTTLAIGHRLVGTGVLASPADAWKGEIDEVRISVGLEPSSSLLHQGMRTTISNAHLHHVYHFDEPAGAIAMNSAGPAGAAVATFGMAPGIDASDPTPAPGIAPLALLQPAGQGNRAAASLVVNGVGANASAGPFLVFVAPNEPMTLTWSGPPNMPLLLIAGPRHAAGAAPACLGSLDIGTGPSYSDVIILADGTQGGFLNPLFRLNASGSSFQSFLLPALPLGEFLNIQGVVLQPAGATCPALLTAAFHVEPT